MRFITWGTVQCKSSSCIFVGGSKGKVVHQAVGCWGTDSKQTIGVYMHIEYCWGTVHAA